MSGKPSMVVNVFRGRAMPAAPAAPGLYNGLLLYQCAVLGLAMCAIYTNAPIYLYTLHASVPPKYLYFLLVLLMAPCLLARRSLLPAYLLSPFALWAGALVVVNLIHLSTWSTGGEAGGTYLVDQAGQVRAALVLTRIQYIMIAVVLGFVVFVTPVRTWLYAAVVPMVLLPCAVLLDFAYPGMFYQLDIEGAVLGRAAAMFINPTMAGEALLHVFILGSAVIGLRYRGPLLLLTGAAVLVTFSRSSIIAWGILLIILIARGALPRSMAVTTIVALVALALGLGSFESYLQSRDDFEGASSNILSRLDFFSNLSFEDDSSEERASVVKAGWELFLDNPVFGAGAGSTLFWSHRGSTHNQLLMLAAEYGLFGIGLWTWLLVILWRGRFFAERALQLAMVFLFAWMSMFTHQMLDADTYWLATFALVSTRAAWTVPGRALHARAQYGRARLTRPACCPADEDRPVLDRTRS
jgi:O-antigen ligase